MGDLSAHFSRSEFRCHGFGHPGHPDHETLVQHELVMALERVRAIAGGHPLRIVSGHRCAWWNKHVGGAYASRHLSGAAADLLRGKVTIAQAEAAGFEGIGTQGSWAVHVDRRPRRARWRY